MSSVDDERRLYECARKYQIIVKQFDQLVEMMDNKKKAMRLSKRRRMFSNSDNNLSTTVTQPTSDSQQNCNDDEAFVQTLTRFLHELKTDTTELDNSTRTLN
ncbi:uncharacterized protein LOC111782160 [Cucurbita pepo subsp. pepo]|uniref:uncharacterized protein LOC111782160 n=1 Tax=Cucurbita pepo subsp. pepo TaxID=3664 RepID=UPI000C9D28A4|nr:uncharacterized protein LOC111782160 [Cucurbita pepo subsp. pepo]